MLLRALAFLLFLVPLSAQALTDSCYRPGDLNGNGLVQLSEVNQVAAALGTSGPGDWNGNGTVQIAEVNATSAATGLAPCVLLSREGVVNRPIDGSGSFPYSDTAWAVVLAWADEPFGTAADTNFCDGNSDDDARALAKAIVAVRWEGTSNTTPSNGWDSDDLKTEIIAELANIQTTDELMGETGSGCEQSGSTWVGDDEGVARNLLNYVVAAMLIEQHAADNSGFAGFVDDLLRDTAVGSPARTLEDTYQGRNGNNAAYALASSTAAYVYLGEWPNIQHADTGLQRYWERHMGNRVAGDESILAVAFDPDNPDWRQTYGSGAACPNLTDPDHRVVGIISALAIDDGLCESGLMLNAVGSGTFDGTGLMTADRAFGNHQGNGDQYAPPWEPDSHENGYWHAIVSSTAVLQTVSPTPSDTLAEYAGAINAVADTYNDTGLWIYQTNSQNSCDSSASCGHPISGDDLGGGCWTESYALSPRLTYLSIGGTPEFSTSHLCCAQYGGGDGDVGKQLSFHGFLFYEVVDTESCGSPSLDGIL